MGNLFDSVKEVLHSIEKYHDFYILVHEKNTGKMMACLGNALGYDNKFCSDLDEAGSIHDIGKLALPSEILEKTGRLNCYEREVINLHPTIGFKSLDKIDHPLAKLAAQINLAHHEAYDGTGYPNGLKKDQIPMEARICAVCDVYDALRAQRPYRKKLINHKAIIDKMLSKKTNGLFFKFDPQILEVFSQMHEQFDAIFSSTSPLNSQY